MLNFLQTRLIHNKDPYSIRVRSCLHKMTLGSHVHKTDPDGIGACGHKADSIVQMDFTSVKYLSTNLSEGTDTNGVLDQYVPSI